MALGCYRPQYFFQHLTGLVPRNGVRAAFTAYPKGQAEQKISAGRKLAGG